MKTTITMMTLAVALCGPLYAQTPSTTPAAPAKPAAAAQTPEEASAAAAKQKDIELAHANLSKLQALEGITEFQQWLQVQRQLQEAQQNLMTLTAPPPAKAEAKKP